MIDSRYLSYLLRHHPEEKGLNLDKYGWCKVDDLLEALDIYQDELDDIVNNNTRYIYSDDKQYIKAAHGHSINISYEKNKATPPEKLYHGTSKKFLDDIKKKGLKRMTRDAIHLSISKEVAKKIGLRHTGGNMLYLIIFELDTKAMLKDGFEFYKSEDGVWLVQQDIPYKYLKIVA